MTVFLKTNYAATFPVIQFYYQNLAFIISSVFSENQIPSVLNSLETTGTFLHSFGRIILLNLFRPMGITEF